MKTKDIIQLIEDFAPLRLQASYDNAGLVCGDPDSEITSVLLCLDITEAVIDEAIVGKHNLIISHHPLIMQGVKNMIPDSNIKKCLIKAVKHDLNIYAAHTNIDSIAGGVSGRMADKLHLVNRKILQPEGKLFSLAFYTPRKEAEKVRNAILDAGAGQIGNYSHCSFNSDGEGTFFPEEGSNPFCGEVGKLHSEQEVKTEITVPEHLLHKSIRTLATAHPYEEPVWNAVCLNNTNPTTGFGIIGDLEQETDTLTFLKRVKEIFGCTVIRHSAITKSKVKRIALCGGSGAPIISSAIAQQADIYITGDIKYHDFFAAENRVIIADIGHHESEQFTKEIFYELLIKKIPKFAVQFSKVKTNPINYL